MNNNLVTLIDAIVYRNKRFQTAVYWKIITQETLKENLVEPTVKWKGYAIKCQSRHDHKLKCTFSFLFVFYCFDKRECHMNMTTWRRCFTHWQATTISLHHKNAKVCVNRSSFHNIQYLKLNEKSLYEAAVRARPLVFEEASYATQLIRSSYNPSD